MTLPGTPKISREQLRTVLKQASLDASLFNELLNGPLTYNVLYRRSHLCPCDDRGGPDPKCPNCNGVGYYWTTPEVTGALTDTQFSTLARGSFYGEKLPIGAVPRAVSAAERPHDFPLENLQVAADGTISWTGDDMPGEFELYTVAYSAAHPGIRALVQSVMTRREYQARSTFDVTDLQMSIDRHLGDGVTLNPAWEAAEHDRFVLFDTWRRYKTVLLRGKRDRLKYERVRAATVTVLVDGQLVTYRQGDDFTLNGGQLIWPDGHGPARDKPYAVDCEISPEYYVLQELPQTRQIDGQDYPRHVVLRGFESFPNRTADSRPK